MNEQLHTSLNQNVSSSNSNVNLQPLLVCVDKINWCCYVTYSSVTRKIHVLRKVWNGLRKTFWTMVAMINERFGTAFISILSDTLSPFIITAISLSSHGLSSGQNIVESVDHDTHINSLVLSGSTVLIQEYIRSTDEMFFIPYLYHLAWNLHSV